MPTFRTVTTTFTVLPAVTEAGAVTLVIPMSVTGAGGGDVPPSTWTAKRFSTRSMRLAIVWAEPPANRSATGFLFPSSVTINEPESPPSEKVPGSMTS